jgi:hypothetical protein
MMFLNTQTHAYEKLMTFEGKLKEKYQCESGYALSTILSKSMWTKRKLSKTKGVRVIDLS